MKYVTETGVGYFVDSEGRVVDRVNVPPGEHEASGPAVEFKEVDRVADLPAPDPAHLPEEPADKFGERVRDVLRSEGLI